MPRGYNDDSTSIILKGLLNDGCEEIETDDDDDTEDNFGLVVGKCRYNTKKKTKLKQNRQIKWNKPSAEIKESRKK